MGWFTPILDPMNPQVRLVLDERTHATGVLASPALASLQGPALLCYNDAQFSEVGWDGMRWDGPTRSIK